MTFSDRTQSYARIFRQLPRAAAADLLAAIANDPGLTAKSEIALGSSMATFANAMWSKEPTATNDTSTTLVVPDSPKMLHETLCFAQTAIRLHPDQTRTTKHGERLDRLISECERHRPLGTDGKHRDLHTPTCGCEDK